LWVYWSSSLMTSKIRLLSLESAAFSFQSSYSYNTVFELSILELSNLELLSLELFILFWFCFGLVIIYAVASRSPSSSTTEVFYSYWSMRGLPSSLGFLDDSMVLPIKGLMSLALSPRVVGPITGLLLSFASLIVGLFELTTYLLSLDYYLLLL